MIEPDTRTLLFTRRVARSEALDTVLAWWGGMLMAGDLEDRARVIECRLKYVPFWRLTACVRGHVEGYRIEYDENLRRKIPLEVALDRNFVWTCAACDTSALGVPYLRNLVGETVPSDIFTGQVTVPEADGVAAGKRAVERGALRDSGIPHITGHRVYLWHPESTLLVYPFWLVRYLYADRTYFATVDGVTGDLVAGRAPGSLFWRVCAFVAATAVSIFAVVVLVVLLSRLFFHDPGTASDVDLFLLLIFMPLVMLHGWGLVLEAFAFARHGAEISTGDVRGGYGHPPEYRPAERDNLAAAIFLEYLFMVTGGLVFYYGGMWAGLVVAAAGCIAYILSCTSWYNPAWETEGRRRGRDTCPVEGREEW
ncbi:MAG: hypothetical protein PHP59_11875 [Methanofollis sp.]|uniref:hypothetical protein n=1 Tax=Methanofollis sp. TaxID=2052835 RepID=UPI0026326193|nr:hypothetical protein [Methanofollis sp.]MDD4256057.1 hypothetical protein [Methanofollis sp.]